MYKLALLLLVAVLAVATAQVLYNPYSTVGYRSGLYGGVYTAPTVYSGYNALPGLRSYGYGYRYY